ncbi:hypothetical protein WR25_21269 isoform B [Diploscapter pachys]|uniref:SET domain-containing protein n=1 Tax=Diploscapter pachys TaxID=2018661 RepID=A0A2A2JDF8_9BILA|nr:hypothetical protein WR25_21269 isoform B [Diploscapter pachys]
MQTDDVCEFLDWCRTQKIEFDGLELIYVQGAGYGLVAKRDFQSEEPVIKLPQKCLITAGQVVEIPKYKELVGNLRYFYFFFEKIKSFSTLPSPFEMLVLFFALEEPQTSTYGPYLKMLPKDFSTPIYEGIEFPESDLPDSVLSFWRQQRQELKVISEKVESLRPKYSISKERLLWAWHIVNTRCIFVENRPNKFIDQTHGDTIAIIPFVDMLNHSTNAQGLALLDKRSSTYMVKAQRFILQDSEVFVCYGPHTNARLYIEYGFKLPDNPYAKVIVNHDLFFELAEECGISLSEKRRDIIRRADLPCHLYATDEGPSWPLRNNARLLLIQEDKL